MELREWVKERFGTTDVKTLLDEEVYSTEDLRKDKAKLEQNIRRIENDQQEHKQRYKKLMQKGAGASDAEKRQYAQKAKFEKKKYNVKKKKHKAQNVKLGTIISIEGMREVLSIQQGQSISLDEAMGDMEAQQLQGEIMDQMAEFGLELEDMKQVQDALDIEVLDNDIETDVSEEMQLMQEMEANEISNDTVTIDESIEDESTELDVDIEDDELDLDDGLTVN
jgi:hypothetical protein